MKSFDQLPPELKTSILELLESSDAIKAAQVSHEWHSIFKPTIKNKLLNFIENDKDACKKINLEQLIAAVDSYLADKQDRIKFFIALKKMESEMIDINTNSLIRSGEKDDLKIDLQNMQNFLLKRFGIAGLIHSYSALCIAGYNSEQSRAESLAPLVALEKLLQQDPDKHSEALDLINELFKNHIIKIEKKDEKIESQLDFKDKKLHLIIKPEINNPEVDVTIDDIISTFNLFNVFKPLVQEKAEKLLQRLAANEQLRSNPS